MSRNSRVRVVGKSEFFEIHVDEKGDAEVIT